MNCPTGMKTNLNERIMETEIFSFFFHLHVIGLTCLESKCTCICKEVVDLGLSLQKFEAIVKIFYHFHYLS